jgi:peroxiredoxin Q/BCP
VLGISVDKPEANKKFATEIGATFPILSDPEKTTTKAYGVLNLIRLFANRVTFVIDKDGVIQHIEQGSDALSPGGAYDSCSLLQHKSQ